MLIKIRNTQYIYNLLETPDGRSYWLEWTDDQGLFHRKTISKWDADKNFQTGIWEYDCIQYSRNKELKMKLIEKELTYNPESFAPELRITVAVPLELMDGQNMVNDENNDVVYALIGRNFLDCIKS